MTATLRRSVLTVAGLAVLTAGAAGLTACGSTSRPGSGGVLPTSTGPTSQAPSGAPTSGSNAVATPTNLSDLPPCASLVGQPTLKAYTTGAARVGCLTGADVASDKTVATTISCGTRTVVSWVSQDPAATDQKEYAGLLDGTIAVVPGGSPAAPADRSAVLRAVGATGC